VLTGLKDQGIEFTGNVIYHLDANLAGGIKTGIVNQGLLNLGFLFDLNKISGVHGLDFFVDLQVHEGRNPSFKLTGDNLIFDGISAQNYVQLYEYWLREKIYPFRFKLGRIDASADFANIVSANYLFNNCFGAIPTIGGFATYPASAFGATIIYAPKNRLHLKFGVFNGYEGLVSLYETYPFGDFNNYFENLLFLAEADHHFFNSRLRTVIGFSYNTSKFSYYHGPKEIIGPSGYAILEFKPDEKFHYFFQAGLGKPQSIIFPYFVSVGCQINHPFYEKIQDYLVVGFGTGFYSKSLANNPFTKIFESTIELTYRLEYKNIGIQPDVQYLINPGGESNPNAFAFILNLDFQI
jgi:carbohydrate-selective porin OprB